MCSSYGWVYEDPSKQILVFYVIIKNEYIIGLLKKIWEKTDVEVLKKIGYVNE